MKRILDENAIAKAKTEWEYYVPQIIKQAKMEKGVHVEKKSGNSHCQRKTVRLHNLHSGVY